MLQAGGASFSPKGWLKAEGLMERREKVKRYNRASSQVTIFFIIPTFSRPSEIISKPCGKEGSLLRAVCA
jgi:hypothetical protein